MAELKFSCPGCGQNIVCDELWGGHNIECPGCKLELTVPQLQASPPPAPEPSQGPGSLVPKPPAGTRLSIGRSVQEAAAAPTAASKAPQAATSTRRPMGAKAPGKKSGAMKWVKIAVAVIVLGVGGYFGWGLISQWQDKANEKRRQAEKNADGGEVGHIGNLYNVLDATEPGGRGLGGRNRGSVPGSRQSTGPRAIPLDADGKPMAQPAPAELPVIPAVWTLEIEAAKIPEGRANGMISGTNFLFESGRIDAVAGAQVLRLTQGAAASPDREILIYLHPKPGESLVSHSWSVAKDVKSTEVTQVTKRWKSNPKYAPQLKGFPSGYALKLELGHISEGMITGKIFVALPDAEQSVVAGIFKVATTLVEAPAAAGAAGAAAPASALAPAPGGASAAEKAAFEKRYGVKR